MADAVDTLEGRRKYSRSQITSSPIGTLRLDPTAKQELEATLALGTPTDMVMVEVDREVLRVFGTKIRMPERRLTITQARPRILDRRKRGNAEEVRVEWQMTDASEFTYSYAVDGSEDG